MAKKVKLILYGEPGVGKSVFAGNAPKPFFITTDGNYCWLEDLVPDFDEKNHIQIHSWTEAQDVFEKLNGDMFKDYETIVVDLVEDLYRWADFELCEKSKVKHISELGDYGKGYDILRKPFVATISKLLAIDKNIILLSHESSIDVKNKKGVTTTKYQPSSVMNIDKVWDKICGQVRFCIRCFKDYEQDENGHTKVKRLLHIINQPDEYGTFRIANPNTPETINLDWNEFANVIGLNNKVESKLEVNNTVKETVKPIVKEPIKETVEVVKEPIKEVVKEEPKVEVKVEEPIKEEPKQETVKVEEPKVEVKEETTTENIVVNEEFLNNCLDEGFKTVVEIETKYNIKLDQKAKVDFIKLKMNKLKK